MRCPATENIDRCHYRNFQAETTPYPIGMNLPPPPKKATMDWKSLFLLNLKHRLPTHWTFVTYISILLSVTLPISLPFNSLCFKSPPFHFLSLPSNRSQIVVPFSSLSYRRNKASFQAVKITGFCSASVASWDILKNHFFSLYPSHTHQFIMVCDTQPLISRVIALWFSLSVG